MGVIRKSITTIFKAIFSKDNTLKRLLQKHLKEYRFPVCRQAGSVNKYDKIPEKNSLNLMENKFQLTQNTHLVPYR